MFRNLLQRLFDDGTAAGRPLSADDANVALAALLVRVARADDHYTANEQEQIDRILMRRHRINAADAAARRMAGEMIEAEAPDTVRFTRLLKERVALDDRAAIIGAMWDVALSDGIRTAEEEAAIRLTARLLGVTDRESAVARQDAAERRDAEADASPEAPGHGVAGPWGKGR